MKSTRLIISCLSLLLIYGSLHAQYKITQSSAKSPELGAAYTPIMTQKEFATENYHFIATWTFRNTVEIFSYNNKLEFLSHYHERRLNYKGNDLEFIAPFTLNDEFIIICSYTDNKNDEMVTGKLVFDPSNMTSPKEFSELIRVDKRKYTEATYNVSGDGSHIGLLLHDYAVGEAMGNIKNVVIHVRSVIFNKDLTIAGDKEIELLAKDIQTSRFAGPISNYEVGNNGDACFLVASYTCALPLTSNTYKKFNFESANDNVHLTSCLYEIYDNGNIACMPVYETYEYDVKYISFAFAFINMENGEVEESFLLDVPDEEARKGYYTREKSGGISYSPYTPNQLFSDEKGNAYMIASQKEYGAASLLCVKLNNNFEVDWTVVIHRAILGYRPQFEGIKIYNMSDNILLLFNDTQGSINIKDSEDISPSRLENSVVMLTVLDKESGEHKKTQVSYNDEKHYFADQGMGMMVSGHINFPMYSRKIDSFVLGQVDW